jgi:hypothetical protein
VIGQTYKFKISAFNLYGEGPLSESITVIPARIPDAPTNVQMVMSNQIQIEITWQEAYNGGDDIVYWKIYWDKGTG